MVSVGRVEIFSNGVADAHEELAVSKTPPGFKHASQMRSVRERLPSELPSEHAKLAPKETSGANGKARDNHRKGIQKEKGPKHKNCLSKRAESNAEGSAEDRQRAERPRANRTGVDGTDVPKPAGKPSSHEAGAEKPRKKVRSTSPGSEGPDKRDSTDVVTSESMDSEVPQNSESEEATNCPCGKNDSTTAGFMILCEKCKTWQHGRCMGFRRLAAAPEVYYCHECRPDLMKKGCVAHREYIRERKALKALPREMDAINLKSHELKRMFTAEARNKRNGEPMDNEELIRRCSEKMEAYPKDVDGIIAGLVLLTKLGRAEIVARLHGSTSKARREGEQSSALVSQLSRSSPRKPSDTARDDNDSDELMKWSSDGQQRTSTDGPDAGPNKRPRTPLHGARQAKSPAMRKRPRGSPALADEAGADADSTRLSREDKKAKQLEELFLKIERRQQNKKSKPDDSPVLRPKHEHERRDSPDNGREPCEEIVLEKAGEKESPEFDIAEKDKVEPSKEYAFAAQGSGDSLKTSRKLGKEKDRTRKARPGRDKERKRERAMDVAMLYINVPQECNGNFFCSGPSVIGSGMEQEWEQWRDCKRSRRESTPYRSSFLNAKTQKPARNCELASLPWKKRYLRSGHLRGGDPLLFTSLSQTDSPSPDFEVPPLLLTTGSTPDLSKVRAEKFAIPTTPIKPESESPQPIDGGDSSPEVKDEPREEADPVAEGSAVSWVPKRSPKAKTMSPGGADHVDSVVTQERSSNLDNPQVVQRSRDVQEPTVSRAKSASAPEDPLERAHAQGEPGSAPLTDNQKTAEKDEISAPAEEPRTTTEVKSTASPKKTAAAVESRTGNDPQHRLQEMEDRAPNAAAKKVEMRDGESETGARNGSKARMGMQTASSEAKRVLVDAKGSKRRETPNDGPEKSPAEDASRGPRESEASRRTEDSPRKHDEEGTIASKRPREQDPEVGPIQRDDDRPASKDERSQAEPQAADLADATADKEVGHAAAESSAGERGEENIVTKGPEKHGSKSSPLSCQAIVEMRLQKFLQGQKTAGPPPQRTPEFTAPREIVPPAAELMQSPRMYSKSQPSPQLGVVPGFHQWPPGDVALGSPSPRRHSHGGMRESGRDVSPAVPRSQDDFRSSVEGPPQGSFARPLNVNLSRGPRPTGAPRGGRPDMGYGDMKRNGYGCVRGGFDSREANARFTPSGGEATSHRRVVLPPPPPPPPQGTPPPPPPVAHFGEGQREAATMETNGWHDPRDSGRRLGDFRA